MAIELQCNCGKNYSLKAEMSGRKLRCGECQAVITVPGRSPSPPPMADSDEMNTSDIHTDMVAMAAAAGKKLCPVCGAGCPPKASICETCGGEFRSASPGAINKVVDRLPKKVQLILGVSIVVLVFGGGGWLFIQSGTGDRAVAEGSLALEDKDFRGARKAFLEAFQWDKSDIRALSGLIEAAIGLKQAPEAIRYGQLLDRETRLLQRNNEDYDRDAVARVLFAEAAFLYERGKTGEAQTALRAVEREKRRPIEGLNELKAHLLFADGKKDEARGLYEDVLAGGTDDPTTYLNLASLAFDRQEIAKARGYIDKAKASHPARANAQLAKIYESQGEAAQALVAWKAAVEADGELHAARYGYAGALITDRSYPLAREQIDAAKNLQGEDVPTLLRRCEIVFLLRDLAETRRQAEQLLELDKSQRRAEYFLEAAKLCEALRANDIGAIKSAQSAVLRQLSTQKRREDYIEIIGILLQYKITASDAERAAAAAVKLFPADAELRILYVKALDRIETGRKLRTEKELKVAIRLAPKDAYLSRKLASLYFETERESEAIGVLRQLADSRPNDEGALFELASKISAYASDSRVDPLPDSQRAPLLREALGYLKRLQGELSSSRPELPRLITAVQTQLLQFE